METVTYKNIKFQVRRTFPPAPPEPPMSRGGGREVGRVVCCMSGRAGHRSGQWGEGGGLARVLTARAARCRFGTSGGSQAYDLTGGLRPACSDLKAPPPGVDESSRFVAAGGEEGALVVELASDKYRLRPLTSRMRPLASKLRGFLPRQVLLPKHERGHLRGGLSRHGTSVDLQGARTTETLTLNPCAAIALTPALTVRALS